MTVVAQELDVGFSIFAAVNESNDVVVASQEITAYAATTVATVTVIAIKYSELNTRGYLGVIRFSYPFWS
jgi:hypothetical protein